MIVIPIQKVYGYITRRKEDKIQVLVFRHSNPAAGVQIPKGTVKDGEETELVRGHGDYLDYIF